MSFFLKSFDNFKRLISKYLMLLLSYYFKFQISMLNIIVKKRWIYFIYIIFVIYGYFGCRGTIQCNESHLVTYIIVYYLTVPTYRIHFLCIIFYIIPTTRKWLIKLVGEEYFIKNLLSVGKLLLRYYLPIFFLFILEILTMRLISSYYFGLSDACMEGYKELYGSNGMIWPDEIKEKFLEELAEINNNPFHQGQGIVTLIGNLMTDIYNSGIKIV